MVQWKIYGNIHNAKMVESEVTGRTNKRMHPMLYRSKSGLAVHRQTDIHALWHTGWSKESCDVMQN